MDILIHYIQIVVLGIVEGVTEFLPISSTGHLLIAEHLLGTSEPDVFNVVIQAGAILAVVFIYWHKIVELAGHLQNPDSRSYVFKLLVSFIITGILGLVVTHILHLKLPESLVPVAWATLIGGFVIFAIEFFSKKLYPHDEITWLEAVFIAIAQIVAAIFPGTSRSGATIMTGLAMGTKRTSATEFSFLVGIPTMFAASGLELVKYRKDLFHGGHQLLIDVTLGFVISAIVAFFVVKWLLRFVVSHTFNGFAIYRVILGIALLVAIAYDPALAEVGKKEEKPKEAVLPFQKETMNNPATLAPASAPVLTSPLSDAPASPVPVAAPPAPTPVPDTAAPASDATTSTTPAPAGEASPTAATPAPAMEQPVTSAPETNADVSPAPSASATNSAPANVPAP